MKVWLEQVLHICRSGLMMVFSGFLVLEMSS